MDGIELKARREALGLNQDDLAKILKVKQVTVSSWETDRRTPSNPTSINEELKEVEDFHSDLIENLCEIGEHASAVLDVPEIQIKTYWSDEAYAATGGTLPAAVHRSAAAWAARLLEEERGIQARIVEA